MIIKSQPLVAGQNANDDGNFLQHGRAGLAGSYPELERKKGAMLPHADRLLPADPATRDIARELYASIAASPIISPHGHVPAQWLAENTAFTDPTSLLITPDHYVTRMLHAAGIELSELGVGRTDMTPDESRAAFRLLAKNWWRYRGTPVRGWMEAELSDLFGVTERLSAETADNIYDTINEALATDEFTPRALWKRFNLAFLATTDDPCDDLSFHEQIAADKDFDGIVVPTFRPDAYLEPGRADWTDLLEKLSLTSGIDTTTFAGLNEALANRRAYFKERGAISSDHSHRDPGTHRLGDTEAEAIFARALSGEANASECDALRRSLVDEQVRMATEDGLTLTMHPAVYRNHHGPSFDRYGADVGGDIPISTEFTQNLQPALNDFGTHPNLNMVAFTMDETVYARELAPLAGFYPSFYIGVPWWFIDAPEAMARFRSAVTEAAGFTRTSGFIDDTRAYCSIPARHDVSRRMDTSFVASLVADHRLDLDEGVEVMTELVTHNPIRAFKLDNIL